MSTHKNIDWDKELLDFFISLFDIKRQKRRLEIARLTTISTRKHTYADGAVMLFLEDKGTMYVLATDGEPLPEMPDAQTVNDIIDGDKVHIIPPATNDGPTIIYLSVNKIVFKATVAIRLNTMPENKEAFIRFLEKLHLGLEDMVHLVQSIYKIEAISTRFNAILETIPQGVVFVDDTGRNTWVNKKAATILNVKENANEPVVIAEAMRKLRESAINKDEIAREGAQLFSTKNYEIKDWKWIFGDPVTSVLNVSCTPAISENTKGRLWVFTDVTFLHLANEQLQELNIELAEKRKIAESQNKAKSDFLANMSHEIRTPMNGVVGMTSLLMGTELTEEQQDYVETIRISGETLLSLINDILDFSKIEAGKLELENQPFSISTVIEETYDLLSVKANEKRLDLLYNIEPNVPGEIIGDITRLRQVLVNLVSNGVKFTDKGEILVSVRVAGEPTDIYNIEFTVKDTGIGIPEDKYYRLFQSFSQTDTSTTRKYGGTGLGLAISQRIVNMMGGNIRVESEYGKGSSFIFNIQVPANRKAKLYNSRKEDVVLKGKKVLILDDNATNLKILKTQCEMWEMQAYTYDMPEKALAAIPLIPFDIAVIDMVLNDGNGVEVAEAIKGNNPDIHLPLILFSSQGSLSMQTYQKNLFAAILHKPTKHNQIRKVMIDVLRKNVADKKPIIPTTIQSQPWQSNIHILVAEDNDINQKIIRKSLEKLGYISDIVFNGLEVLDALDKKHYDLIFMDVMMPEMDGYEATQRIVEMYDKERRPIIIAMTANAMDEDRKMAIGLGMDDYVSKPFRIEEIQAKIEYWLPQILKKSSR